ncbi:MAG TPA: hypothetical protein VFG20_03470 [Planctomycetaceae bacterium]|nr:hypothetical protein [Planctomycetaceae bacterium]
MPMSRRACLRTAAVSLGTLLSRSGLSARLFAVDAPKPKHIAAVVTIYRHGSHADVIVGKILEGWKQDRGPGPNLKLASLYVDQFPDGDMARPMAAKYGFPLCQTIEEAVTLGTNGIPVDGVLSIGEHGDYPTNAKGQKLHPRRRFFEQITDTFKKHNKVVPVFNDKHLGPVWSDALWMYERAQELKVPFMAGSSLPVMYRNPDPVIPFNEEMEAAVGIGYNGLDVYGFHALEAYQSIVERRRGGGVGVKWVECLQGDAVWKAIDAGVIRQDLFDAAIAQVPRKTPAQIRELGPSTLFRFEYLDGFAGAVVMLPTVTETTAVAVKMKQQAQILATRFDERSEPRHPHFAFLLKGLEQMFHTGKPTYPVERTVITSGILDRALTCLADGEQRMATSELSLRYQPVDYPHAPLPALS